MAKFLVIFHRGDMPQDRQSVAEARQALGQWEDKNSFALIDAGAPIRSTVTLGRDGLVDGEVACSYLGWSVIDARDRNTAVRLLQNHPLIQRGARLQINEPV
ncbi:MAG TPA: hypothetical protein VEV45_01475 [Streptosporangiaceae bacterium]|nr:hypothetical protein [Streptosporangiaceae bacterium]